MSFYSSLCLVANTGVRSPTQQEVFDLFMELSVLEPSRANNEFYNLADDIIAYFTSHDGQKTNDRFFTPDTISFRPEIQIMDLDGLYEGRGFTLSLHGNGYFHPLAPLDFLKFLQSSKMSALKTEVQRRFGGRFRRPVFKGRNILNRTIIDGSGDWHWFGSQSM